ncbi:MAG: nucleotidyltransferase family protein [Nitrospirota bacterium]|nr:nucleotidyltransferase family protein [Nitrospirota bacterium]
MKQDRAVSLILLLSRVSPPAEIIGTAERVIKEGIDWKRFCDLSMVHGVAPLIYKNIGSFSDLPEDVLNILKSAYFHNLRDSLSAANELAGIVAALEEEGVDVVPVKGLLMTEELYGDIGLYPSADIDILVKREDVHRAAGTMKETGYDGESGMDDFRLDNYQDVSFHKAGKKPVEMHTSLGKPRYFNLPWDFWWEDLREKDFDGRGYKVLSPEKTLVYACMHLFGHGYSPLKFIVGVAEMLRIFSDVLRWDKLQEYSERYNIYQPMMLSLYLASKLLDAPIPPEIAGRLKTLSPKEEWIYKKIESYVFTGKVRFSRIMFLLTSLRSGLPELVTYLVSWFFPPLKEVSYRYAVPLRSKKIFLYYLLNPVLLLSKKRNV